MNTEIRPCVRCSTEFLWRRGTGTSAQKYCSKKCRQASAFANTLRVRVCEACGAEFKYQIKQGADRRFCGQQWCVASRVTHRKTAQPLCVMEGCRNKRAYSTGICNSCYYRNKRTGTAKKRVWSYRGRQSSGYIIIGNSHHPLAVNGHVYEHRQVLFDSIGAGTHPCHWCAAQVNWVKGSCVRGSLVADHLDGDKTNNSISNLVPACNRCNTSRGLFMKWVEQHRDDPVLWRMYEQARAKTEKTA